MDGRTLKASLGTTKYCSHFMKNQQCPKPDCMYLHELGNERPIARLMNNEILFSFFLYRSLLFMVCSELSTPKNCNFSSLSVPQMQIGAWFLQVLIVQILVAGIEELSFMYQKIIFNYHIKVLVQCKLEKELSMFPLVHVWKNWQTLLWICKQSTQANFYHIRQ